VLARSYYPVLLAALLTFTSTLQAANDWPQGKARQALFIQLGNRLVVYRIQPGMTHSEPLFAQVGYHDETKVVYVYNRPVFTVVPVPDYQKIGEKFFLNTASGQKEFGDIKWRLIDIIDQDGYPLVHARIDIENTLETFGLKFSDKKEETIRSLLDGIGLTAAGESYTPVADLEMK